MCQFRMRTLIACAASIFLLINPQAHAQSVVPLSEEALFHRCYGQFVRARAPKNHPLLQKVLNGTSSGVDACMALLEKGIFASSSGDSFRLAQPEDAESKAVVKTFHDFHRGWIEEANLPDNIYASLTHQLDLEEAAAHFTYALFGTQTPYRTVVTGNRALKVLRNAGPYREYLSTPNTYERSYELEEGEVIGVYAYPEGNTSWWNRSGVEQTQLTALYGKNIIRSKRTFGGGIMGLQTFIWGHSGFATSSTTADGALQMARRWAKHVYSTLLCREAPLLRTSDVSDLVAAYKARVPKEADQIPFRANSNCMSCHASLDPLAATIRNVNFVRTDAAANDRQAHISIAGGLATTDAEKLGLHLVQRDTSFHRRPPLGSLTYRSYTGELVQNPINGTSIEQSLSQLGALMAQKDDLYMCAASRYFNFLTGITVNLTDYRDPRNGGTITDADVYYRQLVKELADSLKSDPQQSVRNLLRRIMSLPLYRTEGMRDPR